MRITLNLILTLVLFRLNSQTVTSSDTFNPPTKTVGTSTLLTCSEMKTNCKPGKLVKNERTGIADTTVVYLDGYVADMTGKRLAHTFLKFINQKTKDPNLIMTDSTGRLRLSGIESGIYTLRVNSFGYQDFIIADLKFGPGDIRNIIVDMGEYCCTKTELKLTDHDAPQNSVDDKTKKDK